MSLAMLALLAAAPIDSKWPLVAETRGEVCRLSVSGNGRFFRITADGLAAGATVRLVLANDDMRPIDRTMRADGAGRLVQFYVPFRWHHTGGRVTVRIAGSDCELATGFDWRRFLIEGSAD